MLANIERFVFRSKRDYNRDESSPQIREHMYPASLPQVASKKRKKEFFGDLFSLLKEVTWSSN
jgi:hypothetical protein